MRKISVALFVIAILSGFLAPFTPVRSDSREELESRLTEIERQIKLLSGQLSSTASQRAALNAQIAKLRRERQELESQIKTVTERITDLESAIGETHESIQKLEKEREGMQTRLALLLQEAQIVSDMSLFEAFLVHGNLSEYLNEQERIALLSTALATETRHTREQRMKLEDSKLALEGQQEELRKLRDQKTIESQELGRVASQRQSSLAQTRATEKRLARSIEESKKEAARIRSRIYQLLHASRQITFGEALDIATWVSQQTGVRPAFLLAILTQESNLGRNVGTCNRAGDPPSKSWKVVMKPSRDHAPFLTITKELGRDPDTTPVSCPMKGKDGSFVGWGGAMGPAQFIPSTWIGYRDKVSAITGKPADPWDIRDAFLAAGVLLRALGASNEANEFSASLRYFSGSTNLSYRFYADSVLAIADRYENDIAALQSTTAASAKK